MGDKRDAARQNATLKDVAQRAGVHAGTASRALNPATQSLVSEATVRAVREAAEALSYRPNSIARGLRMNKTFMVGVVVSDLCDPFVATMVRAAEAVFTRDGYTCIIADTHDDPEREAERIAALRARRVDGLLVISSHREDTALAEAVDHGLPLVLVNGCVERASVPTVTSDHGAGVGQAVRHLVDLGHTAIAHLPGPATLSTGFERARAFQQHVSALGGDGAVELTVECAAFSVAAGAAATRELLDRAHPTAILAGDDQIAVGVLDVLRERGVRCPEDVSLVGYGGMPFMDKMSPPLTTVQVPHGEIGTEGAELLLRWLSDDPPGASVVKVPVELVVRESTAPARRANRD